MINCLKNFFHRFYSFCVAHSREVRFSAVGFCVATVLWGSLFVFTSCRGLWSVDFKGESDKGKITTTVNYVDNDIAVRTDDKETE